MLRMSPVSQARAWGTLLWMIWGHPPLNPPMTKCVSWVGTTAEGWDTLICLACDVRLPPCRLLDKHDDLSRNGFEILANLGRAPHSAYCFDSGSVRNPTDVTSLKFVFAS